MSNRELRYIGRWERKKMSEQVSSMALGVPFRSQIAVSVSQNVRPFLNTLGFRYVFVLMYAIQEVMVAANLCIAHNSHSYRYMRLGTRWQLSNGITIEATRMKAVRLCVPVLLYANCCVRIEHTSKPCILFSARE